MIASKIRLLRPEKRIKVVAKNDIDFLLLFFYHNVKCKFTYH